MSKRTRKLWSLILRHHKRLPGLIYAFPDKWTPVSSQEVTLTRKAIKRAMRTGVYRTDVAIYDGVKCAGEFQLRKTSGGRITDDKEST